MTSSTSRRRAQRRRLRPRGNTPTVSPRPPGVELGLPRRPNSRTRRASDPRVAKDSPLKTIADLKGKKVAVGRGWNVQYRLVRALEDAGLSFDDIQPAWVNNAADARTAFESGKVDAVGLWDPFLAGAQLAGNPRGAAQRRRRMSNNRTFYHLDPQFMSANLRCCGPCSPNWKDQRMGRRPSAATRRPARPAAGCAEPRAEARHRPPPLHRGAGGCRHRGRTAAHRRHLLQLNLIKRPDRRSRTRCSRRCCCEAPAAGRGAGRVRAGGTGASGTGQ